MIVPDFTENKEKSMLLYFDAQGRDIDELMDELEKTYVCFVSLKKELKDGRNYAVMEIEDEE